MSIEINGINKSFGRTKVLNDISLDIPSGEMVALLGPSGSGKTTLLRIIAGLESQSSGKLGFHGTDVSRVHARDRRVGFVFQHYALFRHMTVFDNIAFGLSVLPRRERPNAAAIKQKVEQLLEMVQLGHLANRYPSQLSGGQKQRVALARALAVEPQILLLDEPFGALDAQVRKELRRWLRQLHEELKFTSVFVTHDQEEAMEVADRIVVMSQGNIEQVGSPTEIMREPATRFVLEFMGEVNRLNGEIRGSQLFVGAHQWPLSFQPMHQGSVNLVPAPVGNGDWHRLQRPLSFTGTGVGSQPAWPLLAVDRAADWLASGAYQRDYVGRPCCTGARGPLLRWQPECPPLRR